MEVMENIGFQIAKLANRLRSFEVVLRPMKFFRIRRTNDASSLLPLLDNGILSPGTYFN